TDRCERGFNDFMRGLNSMARDLDPVWGDIGDGIGSVLSLAGDLATAFGPVLAAAFSLFSDVAQAVAPILGEIASILSARLVTVIETDRKSTRLNSSHVKSSSAVSSLTNH